MTININLFLQPTFQSELKYYQVLPPSQACL